MSLLVSRGDHLRPSNIFMNIASGLHSYAPAGEIQQYFAAVARKYDAMRYIKLCHRVVSARWSELAGKWLLKVQSPEGDIFKDECDMLINGMGVLKCAITPQSAGLPQEFRY